MLGDMWEPVSAKWRLSLRYSFSINGIFESTSNKSSFVPWSGVGHRNENDFNDFMRGIARSVAQDMLFPTLKKLPILWEAVSSSTDSKGRESDKFSSKWVSDVASSCLELDAMLNTVR